MHGMAAQAAHSAREQARPFTTRVRKGFLRRPIATLTGREQHEKKEYKKKRFSQSDTDGDMTCNTFE